MPLSIQRVPKGLSDLLSVFGGQTPRQLSEQISGVLELVQFYGLQQRQVATATNAALAEGALVAITVPTWTVLFGAEVIISKTATMTALRGAVVLQRGGSGSGTITLAAQELGPFGATETGFVSVPAWLPYPLILPPQARILGQPQIIGTDANAVVTISAEIGTLG